MPPAKRRRSQTDFTADDVAAAVAKATASAKKAATTAAKTAAAATAAAAAATREQNWLCSICKDLYFKPTSTPCGHTFCLVCIKSALDVKEECPNCRADIPDDLPLAVNIDMQEFIAENAGPLFIARKAKLKMSEGFYKELVDLDPMSAFDALSPDVDLNLFVGDASLKLTPLLWACKNAKDVKVIEWNHLIKALLNAGADVNARDSEGVGALYLACASCDVITSTTALPALLDRGAREYSALRLGVQLPTFYYSAENINTLDAIMLRMVEDASFSHESDITLTQKRADLANMLKNGLDRTAVALFDQNVHLELPQKMLKLAASGGCVLFIRKLLAEKLVPVDHVFVNKQTALHIACLSGKENAAFALLECGASDFFLRDEFNRTPLDYAIIAKMMNFGGVILKEMQQKQH